MEKLRGRFSKRGLTMVFFVGALPLVLDERGAAGIFLVPLLAYILWIDVLNDAFMDGWIGAMLERILSYHFDGVGEPGYRYPLNGNPGPIKRTPVRLILSALPIYPFLRHSPPLVITGTTVRRMLSRSSSSSSFFVSSSADEECDNDAIFQGINAPPNSKTIRYEEMQILFRRLELKSSQEELTKSSSLTSLNDELKVDFETPDGPDNITLDDNGNIHSATIPKLIEKLTTAVGNPHNTSCHF